MIKPLVMIIEDDKSFGDVILKKVTEYGYEALQVFSAKEAKKILLKTKYIQP
jgi:DNA-binding response OmpR family regulator